MQPITKQEAKIAGLKTYFTGIPCKRNHTAERRVDNSTCLLCIKTINHEFYQANKDREKKRSSVWKSENKDLIKESRKKYVSSNREKVRLAARNYYANNSGKVLSQNKEWAKNNKEKISESKKAYRASNPEKIKLSHAAKYIKRRTAAAEWAKKYYKENITVIAARKAKWHLENKEKSRAARWRRKAKIKEVGGSFSGSDIKAMLIMQKNSCVNCMTDIRAGYEIDHIMPIHLGGSNFIENIQLLCRPCNRSKWAKHPIDWAKENGRLL